VSCTPRKTGPAGCPAPVGDRGHPCGRDVEPETGHCLEHSWIQGCKTMADIAAEAQAWLEAGAP
jgi:hypothetical protein